MPSLPIPNSLKSRIKLYNFLVVSESVIVTTILIYSIYQIATSTEINYNNPARPYAIRFIIEGLISLVLNLYLLFFTIDSLLRYDSFQLIVSLVIHAVWVVYNFMRFTSSLPTPSTNDDGTRWFMIPLGLTFATTCFMSLAYWIIVPSVIRKLRMNTFEQIGADPVHRKRYFHGKIFFSLLKCDGLACTLTMMLLFLHWAELQVSANDYIAYFGLTLLTVVWLFVGYMLVCWEISTLLLKIWSIFGLIGQPMFFIWIIVQVLQVSKILPDGAANNPFYRYDTLERYTVVTFAVLSILSRCFLLYWSIWVVCPNFGFGLSDIWAQENDLYGLLSRFHDDGHINVQTTVDYGSVAANVRRQHLETSSLHHTAASSSPQTDADHIIDFKTTSISQIANAARAKNQTNNTTHKIEIDHNKTTNSALDNTLEDDKVDEQGLLVSSIPGDSLSELDLPFSRDESLI